MSVARSREITVGVPSARRSCATLLKEANAVWNKNRNNSEIADLLEEVRSWLVDEKVGLIGPRDVVAMADRAIERMDQPPDYLIALSLGEPLDHVDRLDLVKHPLTNADLRGLAERLLARLKVDGITLEDVALVAARISFPRNDDAIGTWADFAWITDELDLIEQGAKDGANFRQKVEKVLRRIAEINP